MKARALLTSALLLAGAGGGCSIPWTPVVTPTTACCNQACATGDGDGELWLQKRGILFRCRVTAHDKNGVPVPVCVRAVNVSSKALKRPYRMSK